MADAEPAAVPAPAETLVDVTPTVTDATVEPAPVEGDAAAIAAATEPTGQELTIGEAKFNVDPAVAQHIADLTAKAEAAPKAPDAYQLTVPDELKDQVKVDAEDPRWQALQAVAKEHGLPQDTVSAILASHYQAEAASAASDAEAAKSFHTEEQAKMLSAFNDGGNLTDEAAAKKAQGVADWAVTLLGPDIAANPVLAEELAVTAQTAAGVQLLAAIKARVGGHSAPAVRDISQSTANPWKTGKEFNLTEQGKIYIENPDLAKTLEQQARAA